MTWRVEFDVDAVKALKKMDRQFARRITTYLKEVAQLSDPTARGKPLSANHAGLWRYRVGDYRVICQIEHDRLVILVLDAGKRETIYR